jgi:hypothetical protein
MEFIARLARAHGLQQAGVRRLREFAARLVAGSAELKFCPAPAHACDRHLVFRQRAGFVRAHDGHAPQRLCSGQFADQRLRRFPVAAGGDSLLKNGMSAPNSSPAISIATASEPDSYAVEVRARTTTRHRVTISPAYLRELGIDEFPSTDVLREAFLFLLEREPNSSVLRSFDLNDIERYFPEFRKDIAQRLRG